MTDTRKSIIAAMQDGKQTIAAITEHSGLSVDNVKQTLGRMVKKGEAEKEERGCYTLPAWHRSTPVTPVTLSLCHFQTPKVTK